MHIMTYTSGILTNRDVPTFLGMSAYGDVDRDVDRDVPMWDVDRDVPILGMSLYRDIRRDVGIWGHP